MTTPVQKFVESIALEHIPADVEFVVRHPFRGPVIFQVNIDFEPYWTTVLQVPGELRFTLPVAEVVRLRSSYKWFNVVVMG